MRYRKRLANAGNTPDQFEARILRFLREDIDHAEYLGTDVLGIAKEKVGIIKPGAVAVIAEQDPAVAQVLLERCVEVEAQVARQGAEFGVESREIAIGG